ncbi:biosynthetic arginine decarboxylase [Aliikangiella sp. G2MR2-5]|uniref:biosynthetic arginine decarboxylase n=1 Tax=Aliikangiella sp. G2MR2-5 TaxID=2788943 RepID=UPI0018AC3C58|nr:biosynthetic arginine decarboxylase [Aliikangiella sp. G2MR2-5]
MLNPSRDFSSNPSDFSDWSVDSARAHYNLPYWSGGFFDLDEDGQLVVRPDPLKGEKTFALSTICQQLKGKGLSTPTLLRFVDILACRVTALCESFNQSIEELEYQGTYTVCYPIKVNQQRRVVEGLVNANRSLEQKQVGLEAGSKPELMAVLALSENTNSTIVCNGYKDKEYVRAALIAERLGHKVYIVVEKLSELELVLAESSAMGIEARIGVRARLATKGESKWQDSGGDHSKFGLSASQMLRVVERLSAVKKLNIFQLLHFHLGSQITSIADIQNGLRECSRFYAELRSLGVPISILDIGGGLGVDYEGTQSRSHCSVNYTLAEYASNVVGAFKQVCEENDLPHPSIITESGRALTAHHAVLIANVIGVEKAREIQLDESSEADHPLISSLWQILKRIESTPYETTSGDLSSPMDDSLGRQLTADFHSAEHYLKQAQEMFSHGVVGLRERALAERLYRNILFAVKSRLHETEPGHAETIAQLESKLASKFFVNFSVFQSLPDAWAIDQIFPIMPLGGLDKAPSEVALLQDITCDSDGMIKQYVNRKGITPTIDLPEYIEGEDYLLGLFLVGAYQEILGDMHNLFGDTHTVDLKLDEEGELRIIATESGDSVEELLDYVDFGAKSLLESYKRQLKESDIEQSIQRQYLAELRQGIYGYCYLEE